MHSKCCNILVFFIPYPFFFVLCWILWNKGVFECLCSIFMVFCCALRRRMWWSDFHANTLYYLENNVGKGQIYPPNRGVYLTLPPTPSSVKSGANSHKTSDIGDQKVPFSPQERRGVSGQTPLTIRGRIEIVCEEIRRRFAHQFQDGADETKTNTEQTI